MSREKREKSREKKTSERKKLNLEGDFWFVRD